MSATKNTPFVAEHEDVISEYIESEGGVLLVPMT